MDLSDGDDNGSESEETSIAVNVDDDEPLSMDWQHDNWQLKEDIQVIFEEFHDFSI